MGTERPENEALRRVAALVDRERFAAERALTMLHATESMEGDERTVGMLEDTIEQFRSVSAWLRAELTAPRPVPIRASVCARCSHLAADHGPEGECRGFGLSGQCKCAGYLPP